VVLIEALNILAGYRLSTLDGITRKHLLIEAMRRAYRDRAEYLGDPDFVNLPLARLLDRSYARVLGASIALARATPSAALPAIREHAREAANTSHFSILDTAGNRVAATLSINYPFGSGFIVPGTGIVLNDEMDDFAINPGLPNIYGLVGGQANALAPGKRPLSSMTPTFLETPDRVAILGTPGGSRIISMVLLAVLDFAAGRAPLSWVSLPRFHHQYLPDQVEYEPGALNEMEQAGLRRRGHRLQALTQSYGNMQAILWDKTRAIVEAASDPRGEGSANLLLPVQRSCRRTASTPCRAYGSSRSRHGSR
jgi:gamma-glutamyltranspeptidase / glutathione hydrolase